MALTELYNGSSTDNAAIVTAVGATLSVNLVIIPNGNTQGVLIFKDN